MPPENKRVINEKLFFNQNTLRPIEIISACLRAFGLNYSTSQLKNRSSAIFQLTDESLESIIGLRIDQDSPFSFSPDEGLTYRGKPIKTDDNLKFNLIKRGWRPNFYFKGRFGRSGELNSEAVLNLNVDQYCNNRCVFCTRTYMNDSPEDYRGTANLPISLLLNKAAGVTSQKSLTAVEQISLVSGIKHEKDTEGIGLVLKNIYQEAGKLGFNGRILYAGYQMEEEDLEIVKNFIPNFIWFQTIEAFDRRGELMPSPKGEKNIEEIVQNLHNIHDKGVKTSFFYIAGLDSIERMEEWMKLLSFVDELPNVNLFDVYNETEKKVRDQEYINDPILYVLKVAQLIKTIYLGNQEPDRGRLDGEAGLWSFRKGVYQPEKAYVIGDYWRDVIKMGEQGKVIII